MQVENIELRGTLEKEILDKGEYLEVKFHQGGHLVKIDKEDVGTLTERAWSVNVRNSSSNPIPYLQRVHRGPTHRRTILFHRDILKAEATERVEHINGDSLDNRRSNLRIKKLLNAV